MKRDMKDRVVRMGSMNGVFSIKSCYFIMELRNAIPFPMAIIWNS